MTKLKELMAQQMKKIEHQRTRRAQQMSQQIKRVVQQMTKMEDLADSATDD